MCLGLAASLTLLSFHISADTSEDQEMESELRFLSAERDTVFTASRTEERTDKSIATSTVVTQEDIRRMGARTLSDALRIVPGIGITQTGLGVSAIDVRGVRTSTSDKVLMLLNGHPLDQDLANPGSTWVYDDLAVDTIKRIEVVRGSSSALYGANAMMAVINIITLTPKDIHGVQTSVGLGNDNTEQYRLSAGKQFDNGEAVVHFNFRNTDGAPTTVGQDVNSTLKLPSQAPGTGSEPVQRYDLEWQAGYEGYKLDGRFISKHVNPLVNPYGVLSNNQANQYDNYFLRLSRDWSLHEDLTLSTQVYYDSFSERITGSAPLDPGLFNEYKRQFNTPPPSNSQLTWNGGSDNTRTGGEIQTNYRLSRSNTLMGGATLAEETYADPYYQEYFPPYYASTNNGKSRSRTRWGIYLQDMWEVSRNLHLSLGARYDKYSDFSGVFNPRLGFNWEFIHDYSLKASYGSAYRAPTPGELDLNTNPRFQGNPSLEPEREKTFETGFVAHPIPGLTAQTVYFQSRITNMISLVGNPYGKHYYENQGMLITQGVELETRYDFQGQFHGSYLLVNYVNQNPFLYNHDYYNPSNGNQYQPLNGVVSPFVPRNRVNVIANWQFDRHWNGFANVLYNGSINRAALNDSYLPNLPGYALLNLSVLNRGQIVKGLDVGLTIYNLFNQYYVSPTTNIQFPGDFSAPGRTFYGHVNLRF
ncbi:TonB-dependent receptor [Candidatus Methylospira mobilis]|nr:TonB-dependent receptor [Candidatus Methylospira mobilis]WNV04488.1 TonB-dependent receptor [Candidatus Methylospira mobilis]